MNMQQRVIKQAKRIEEKQEIIEKQPKQPEFEAVV